MTTDFRALCAELVEAFKDENTYTQRVEALDRARTALAAPPPEPPADGEVGELVRWMRIVPQGILHQVEGKLRQQQEAQH